MSLILFCGNGRSGGVSGPDTSLGQGIEAVETARPTPVLLFSLPGNHDAVWLHSEYGHRTC